MGWGQASVLATHAERLFPFLLSKQEDVQVSRKVERVSRAVSNELYPWGGRRLVGGCWSGVLTSAGPASIKVLIQLDLNSVSVLPAPSNSPLGFPGRASVRHPRETPCAHSPSWLSSTYSVPAPSDLARFKSQRAPLALPSRAVSACIGWHQCGGLRQGGEVLEAWGARAGWQQAAKNPVSAASYPEEEVPPLGGCSGGWRQGFSKYACGTGVRGVGEGVSLAWGWGWNPSPPTWQANAPPPRAMERAGPDVLTQMPHSTQN